MFTRSLDAGAMAEPSPIQTNPAELLISGSYAVDLSAPLTEFGGGQSCFAVVDRMPSVRSGVKRDLMAVQVGPMAPPRPLAFTALAGAKFDYDMQPVAHGRAASAGGGYAWFVVCPQPPGPAVWPDAAQSIVPWSETDLLVHLIRPAALLLDQLDNVGVTHRAIRPNNVFRSRAGHPVSFGGGWSAPPAFLQPAAFEPPYSAMCHRAGRGGGSIADDVYALGVLMLALASGRMPMEGLDDETVIRRKLDRGSFSALTEGLRVSAAIADLARVMLAEDPDHRPLPSLLADPMAARARRVAARPAPRASRKLDVGSQSVWEARGLAAALASEPEAAVRLLRSQAVAAWLRRILNDHTAATAIEDAVRSRDAETSIDAVRADGLLLMTAVATLDPLAPLCWRGVALFPDGVGPMLAAEAANAAMMGRLEAMIAVEAIATWVDLHPNASNAAVMRLDARQMRMTLRIAGWSGGMARLRYSLNSHQPCLSPMLAGQCVVRLNDLLMAMENMVTASAENIVDREIAGFISARYQGRMDDDFTILARTEDPAIDPPGEHGMAQLRVVTRLGELQVTRAWPRLAAHILRAAKPGLRQWQSRATRQSREAALVAAAEAGQLPGMLMVLQDAQGLALDSEAAAASQAEISGIDRALRLLAEQGDARAIVSRNTGQEIAAAFGVIAMAASVMFAVRG